jgi:hypothetical protein
VWAEFVEQRAAQGYDPEVAAQAVRDGRLGATIASGDTKGLRGSIGTPQQVREYLRRYEEAGVDQVIFVLQAGRNKHEHIMESIELFGREVLPEFVERDSAQTAAKQDRLAPVIDAAMARKVRPTADVSDYSFKAYIRELADKTGDPTMRRFVEQYQEDRAAGRDDTALTN